MSEQEPLEVRALPREPPPTARDGETRPDPLGELAREEFAAFYRRFVTTLAGFLVWQGSPSVLAADLAQETMIKAYRHWSQIASPMAWTRRVASRELVRHLSRVEEEPRDQVPEETALLPRPEELIDWENRQEILELLAALPPRQRQVLAWSVDGYDPAEIAEELGIEPAAVRANLYKARLSIARRMKAREEES